jgi:N-acetylglucosaminyldiphosphoundecaprenol N-acetyl-beta-D-mannosaminyltransferase
MSEAGRFNLLGVKVAAVNYETAVQEILDAAKARKPLGVSALAVHGVMTGVLNVEHRHRLNHLELIVPDGQPVRWGLNLLHNTQLKDRVYGPELMLRTCQSAEQNGLGVFLFGGKPELLNELESKLLTRFPNLKIAGKIASKFRRISAEEKMQIIGQIQDSGAAITFVGLGCPRQEVWTFEFKDHLRMPVLAVGAAFNFHAGQLAQAPPLMQKSGTEWLFRFTREPKRLWKRYLILNPLYLTLLFLQWTRLKRFDVESTNAPKGEILYG